MGSKEPSCQNPVAIRQRLAVMLFPRPAMQTPRHSAWHETERHPRWAQQQVRPTRWVRCTSKKNQQTKNSFPSRSQNIRLWQIALEPEGHPRVKETQTDGLVGTEVLVLRIYSSLALLVPSRGLECTCMHLHGTRPPRPSPKGFGACGVRIQEADRGAVTFCRPQSPMSHLGTGHLGI